MGRVRVLYHGVTCIFSAYTRRVYTSVCAEKISLTSGPFQGTSRKTWSVAYRFFTVNIYHAIENIVTHTINSTYEQCTMGRLGQYWLNISPKHETRECFIGISTHQEESWKYNAQRIFFNEIRGAWIAAYVFSIETKIKKLTEKLTRQNLCYLRSGILGYVTLGLSIIILLLQGKGTITTYFLNGKDGFTKPLPDLKEAASLSEHEFK